MDIKRVELKRLPPREPLDSLAALVRDFLWRFPRERRDTVVTLCQEASSLAEAIQLATDSIKADGKHHNHQVKVRKAQRDLLAASLKKRQAFLKILAKDKDDGFHRLWTLIDTIKPWGVGPLTVYDVAVRVGAYLGIEPQYLYLHTGARAGLIALVESMVDYYGEPDSPGEAAQYIKDIRKSDWMWPRSLPARFDKVMTMDETEDFLCTYRSMYADLVDFDL